MIFTEDLPADKKFHAFLALPPPPGLTIAWSKFQAQSLPPNLRWVAWHQLHLTLYFWPEVDKLQAQRIFAFMQEQFPSGCRVTSQIRGFHYFSRASVLYLRETSPDLVHLEKQLRPVVENLPVNLKPKISQDFSPHWTVARKFAPPILYKEKEYFYLLDKFEFTGSIPCLSLYLTLPRRYRSAKAVLLAD